MCNLYLVILLCLQLSVGAAAETTPTPEEEKVFVEDVLFHDGYVLSLFLMVPLFFGFWFYLESKRPELPCSPSYDYSRVSWPQWKDWVIAMIVCCIFVLATLLFWRLQSLTDERVLPGFLWGTFPTCIYFLDFYFVQKNGSSALRASYLAFVKWTFNFAMGIENLGDPHPKKD